MELEFRPASGLPVLLVQYIFIASAATKQRSRDKVLFEKPNAKNSSQRLGYQFTLIFSKPFHASLGSSEVYSELYGS